MNPVPYILPLFLSFSPGRNWQSFHQTLQNKPMHIHWVSQGDVGNSMLNSNHLFEIAGGGFIDQPMKTAIEGNLGGRNRIGLDLGTELFFTKLNDSLFGRDDWGYYVGASYRMMGDVGMSSDAMRLLLNGNGPYRGETLDLTGTRGDFSTFQKIQFGFIKTWRPKRENGWHHQLGFSISYVNGNINRAFDLGESSLYTDPDGQYLDMQVRDMQFSSSDPDRNSFFFPNGTGAATSLFYEMGNSRHTFSVALNDLGFIGWNDLSPQTRVLGDFRWEGFVIPNLANIGENFFEDYGDSLRATHLLEEANVARTTLMPFQVSLGYAYRIPSWSFIAGVDWRPLRNHFPAARAAVVFQGVRWFQPALTGGYGGYARWNAGVDLAFLLRKSWVFGIQTAQIAGWFPNAFGSAWQAGFRMSKSF